MILVVIDENGHVCETASDPSLAPQIRRVVSGDVSAGELPYSREHEASAPDARSVVIDIDEDGIVDDSAPVDGCTLIVLDLGLIGLRIADGCTASEASELAACPASAPDQVRERVAFWADEIAAEREPRSW